MPKGIYDHSFLKGRKRTLETRLKMKIAQTGKKQMDVTREKISKARQGKHNSPKTEFKKGIHYSPKTEFKKGQSNYWQGKKRPEISGEKCHFWKGGISFKPYALDWTETLKRSIRERDHYICQLCEELQSDRAFDVHHIDYNKNNSNSDNLITLCHKCHLKTNQHRNY